MKGLEIEIEMRLRCAIRALPNDLSLTLNIVGTSLGRLHFPYTFK